MVFYFFILLLWLLSYLGFKFFFFKLLPHKTNLPTGSKTYCLYIQDIKSTKWQIMVIIEKREEDF